MKRLIQMSVLLFLTACAPDAGQGPRPIHDDTGFAWKPEDMNKLVQYLESQGESNTQPLGLVAAISPHDDYLYDARTYYSLYSTLRAREIVVFGVTHLDVRQAIGDPENVIILDTFPEWTGMKKNVSISSLRESIKSGMNSDFILVSDQAHLLEHSIEAMIPFLQYYNDDIKLTPIMITRMPLAKMEEITDNLARVIAGYMKERNLTAGRDIFFIISSDGNHYGADFKNSPFGEDRQAHENATEMDRRLVEDYLLAKINGDVVRRLTEEIWGATYNDYGKVHWCGRYSIPFGLLTVQKIMALASQRTIKGSLCRYSDTFTDGVIPLHGTDMGITAPFSYHHWVSDFSIGYFAE